MAQNHTPNEQQYVPDLKHSEQVKSLHEGLAEGVSRRAFCTVSTNTLLTQLIS